MKFHGTIGFWIDDEEVDAGVYMPHIVERSGYHGEILRNMRRAQPVSNQQNDDLVVNNQLSILSDLYLQQHWSSVRYVVWNGARLKVTNVEVGYPRIILEVGGVYNGPTVENASRDGEESSQSGKRLSRSS